jgi:tetratricopeptide (TPR) repeat protein
MRKIVACFLILAFATASGTADVLPYGDAYLAARRAELSKNYPRAITLYETCADLGGPLAHYARVASARCIHATGDAAGAEEGYRTLIEKGPEGPWQLQARAALGMLYQEEEHAPAAVELLRPIVAVSPEPWWMQPYAWRAAEHSVRSPEMEALGYAYFRQAASNNPYQKLRLEASRLLAVSSSTEDRAAAVLGFARGRAFPEAGATLMGMAVDLFRDAEAPTDINRLLADLLNQDANEDPEASVSI